jgi:ComF family protein
MIAAGRYSGVLRGAIHAMKFKHQREVATVLAGLLAAALSPAQPKSISVMSVPTATARARRRGFDHAAVIAKRVAANLNLPYEQALFRRSSQRQVGLNREGRLYQAKNQFGFKGNNEPERILLIDDVVTTGATLSACARELKQAGARQVVAAVLAQD